MYQYCILPGGNSNEFASLDNELGKRGIDAYYCEALNGTRLYRISESDIAKLPEDKQGFYLGDEQSGHSIYPLNDVSQVVNDLGCGEWISISKKLALKL